MQASNNETEFASTDLGYFYVSGYHRSILERLRAAPGMTIDDLKTMFAGPTRRLTRMAIRRAIYFGLIDQFGVRFEITATGRAFLDETRRFSLPSNRLFSARLNRGILDTAIQRQLKRPK